MKTKKLLSILALLCITASSAWADFTPQTGDEWNSDTKTLTVNSDPKASAYRNKTEIEHLIFANAVTTINNQAFMGCTNLASITFGSGLTTINAYAFQGCTNLTTVTLPASVTAIVGSFNGCTNLTTVTLNSNPAIVGTAFPSGATVTMNLTAHEGETGEYWMTFYNKYQNFQVPTTGTQIFKAALSGTSLKLTELTAEDKTVTKDNAVILKSTTGSTISLTLTTTASSNDFSSNSLLGVSAAAGLTAPDPSTIYVLNNGSQGVGFYKLAGGNTLEANEAYLTYDGSEEFLGFSSSEPAEPATYTVSLKEGTEDATSWQGKAGTGDYQELPLTGLEAGTAVSVKYSGTKKVKSVKAKKKQ